ncbi:MAG: anaerobic ribonucleoside-triphosphate reductase activating protein [Chitinispirillaceae bacterium]|nr:anaerobic ribonucleoside-triphosphate reductase activating protein [Chitinispirillaceae bacterium]
MPGGDRAGIGGWLKYSFIDFPGTVSTVLFFRGCNLRCPYCHNPALVNGTTEPVKLDEVAAYLVRRRGIIEGAVLSGGEPTLQRELPEVAERLRRLGMKIKLDTNGLLPDMITATAPDYLALDLKTTPSRYGELGWQGGACEEAIGQSLAIVKSMGKSAEVRVTMAAPFVGEAEIEVFMTMLQGVRTVYLQPFRVSGELLDPGFAARGHVAIETIHRFRDRLAGVVGRCVVRGEGEG